ncbi:MAG: NADH:ubiquinone reductase (Na(+)-transporting) subunit C, partial [Thermoguttaceae bacterium]|nr:NADH:ubiquinone reductase (Na(+)-transporting) subunit C [Thermoguttaceae bacterium]
MNNESIFKTFGVATGVCVVCAIIVSFSSVALKGLQDQNKLLDKQVNVLKAAGLVPTDGKATKAEVAEKFKTAEIVVVDLATGAVVADADPSKVESDKTNVVALTPEQDVAKIKTAPKQAVVYRFNDETGALKTLVLPICGTGLWSRMNGFLSLNADLTTVAGLVFYEHGETPGLGGEISNPKWTAKSKSSFNSSRIFSLSIEIKYPSLSPFLQYSSFRKKKSSDSTTKGKCSKIFIVFRSIDSNCSKNIPSIKSRTILFKGNNSCTADITLPISFSKSIHPIFLSRQDWKYFIHRLFFDIATSSATLSRFSST